MILSLDFVKCFDKCSFDILFGSLDFFEFGTVIKKWTHILYKDFSVKIQNNGYFSDKIEIQKGVHQGGCCSSIYFLVIAEILALSLRHNQDIEGVSIADILNLLNQFADDMDIFSLATEKSLKAIHGELNQFHNQSGFTVSYDKTTLYRIGSLRHSNAEMYGLDQFAWSNTDITVLGVTISHEDIVERNYKEMPKKIRSILNAWGNRSLSLLGKVQIVNSLVASLFVYKMMVLPTIPDKIVKNVDNMIREFLWEGKKAKIAYKILQNPKKEGGLNLVNLRNKDKALKTSWPKILKQEEQYATMVYKTLKVSSLREDVWRASLNQKDAKMMNIGNNFWKNVLDNWCEINYYWNRRIDNQLIWLNSQIRIRDKVILWSDVQKRGLKYVYQLFKEGRYKTENEMWSEFGLSSLRYNSLKVSLPRDWRDFFLVNSQKDFLPVSPHNYDLSCNVYGKKWIKTVYNLMAEDVLLVHNKFIKWKAELGSEFCETVTDFGQLCLDIYRITNIAKYRSFQYRILQRGIVTNVQLYQWKLIESDACTYCKETKESIIHLFCECPIIKKVWEDLKTFLETRFCANEIDLSASAIIKNRIVKVKSHVLNFVCLIVKQFIYGQRCLEKPISVHSIIGKINQIERIEKYIACKNNKQVIHVRKWHPVATDKENNVLNEYVNQYIEESLLV